MLDFTVQDVGANLNDKKLGFQEPAALSVNDVKLVSTEITTGENVIA